MKLTGTIINYYFHCKRQCWLFANRINLEDNSEDVRIGRILHEINSENKKNTEIAIDNVKVDRLTADYIVEIKKSDADIEAATWQVLLYIKTLKDKGIERKGKIEFIEKNKQDKKNIYVELTDENEQKLEALNKEINELVSEEKPPIPVKSMKCKKCAYNEYCFI